jgi:hypothetical protein
VSRRLTVLAPALLALCAGAAVGQPAPPAAPPPVQVAPPVGPAPVPAPPPAPEPPQTEAFQGLAWGADEAQIAARFGSRLLVGRCDDPIRREAAQGGESCEIPTVPRYEVAGIPFTLRLHLDAATRRLVRVTLRHTGEPLGEDPRRSDDARFGDEHRTLRRLLTQRYGSPEASEVNNEPGHNVAYARWRRGEMLIELTSTFVPGEGDRPPQDRVKIVYQPVRWGDAGKL